MIYQFRCPVCGEYKEVVRHHSESGLSEYCRSCRIAVERTNIGVEYGKVVMDRVYSVPNIAIPNFGEYNPGLGVYVRSKKDIIDAQKRIRDETGREVIEVGNEKINVKPQISDYSFPRGIWDNAIKDG
jgi:hypothetical protein